MIIMMMIMVIQIVRVIIIIKVNYNYNKNISQIPLGLKSLKLYNFGNCIHRSVLHQSKIAIVLKYRYTQTEDNDVISHVTTSKLALCVIVSRDFNRFRNKWHKRGFIGVEHLEVAT